MKNRLDPKLLAGIEPSRKAQISKAAGVPKRKNWLHVNIGEQEQKKIRCLVECYGVQYRTFLELAIRSEVRKIADLLRNQGWEAAKISRAKRKAMGCFHRRMSKAIGYRNPAKN